ncbi:hypothetical protein T440DRAFT_75092 [Plenodomus tracheiphilus IPT5]|uniref:Uncharacterized protein n=1 Tax=Plenodomus tracheiphilus IPT5 TaxID=1408161 RepID=A0A6A7B686_9PLEO|nr:hypothetical protein T440DRAFT_75092 [Plenodomus tracheiphilus IPT5]
MRHRPNTHQTTRIFAVYTSNGHVLTVKGHELTQHGGPYVQTSTLSVTKGCARSRVVRKAVSRSQQATACKRADWEKSLTADGQLGATEKNSKPVCASKWEAVTQPITEFSSRHASNGRGLTLNGQAGKTHCQRDATRALRIAASVLVAVGKSIRGARLL